MLPDPAAWPVIPPVTAPIVQLYVVGAVDDNAMFVAVLLQILAVDGTPDICGVGLTVTTTLYGADDAQLPVVLVAVIKYSTVPAVALLGLISVWAIVLPDPAACPVILPVTAPIVQL